jgi:hypothetical protein
MVAKVLQTFHANKHRKEDKNLKVGNKAMLCTLNHRREYKNNHLEHIAKFMPCFDSPYVIMVMHPEYTLDLPNHPNIFPLSMLQK